MENYNTNIIIMSNKNPLLEPCTDLRDDIHSISQGSETSKNIVQNQLNYLFINSTYKDEGDYIICR